MHHTRFVLTIALIAIAGALPAPASTALEDCWQRSADRVELGSCLATLVEEVDADLQSTLARALEAQGSLDEVTGRDHSLPALRRAQMAFELYRELECSARRAQMASGTGADDTYRSCWVELGRARIAALREQGGAEPAVIGSAWVVASIAGQPVPDGLIATLTFTDDGQIRGTTGCNNYFGAAKVTRHGLELGPVGATRRLCSPPENELEESFLAALEQAATWQLDGQELAISDAEDKELLRLEAAPNDADALSPQ